MQPPIRSPLDELGLNLTRRRFFAAGSHPIGAAALSALLADEARPATAGAIGPHFAPRAKHVIYLHMVGGPPQQDMFDYKPMMNDWYDKDLPASIRNGQRLTTMTSGQKRFPIAPSKFKFARHGECGMWVTELLPWTSKICASSARCTPRRSTTSRPSPTCRPATRSPAARASVRGSATASAR
jgi:hypothetical protein